MKFATFLSALTLATSAIGSPLLNKRYCNTGYSTVVDSSCPIWTMTFTNDYDIPDGHTGGELVTATYTDTQNCAPTTRTDTYVECVDKRALEKRGCVTTSNVVTTTECPIWTMTFTNEYNVPPGQTGNLVTATYTDTNNCAPTEVYNTEVTCVA